MRRPATVRVRITGAAVVVVGLALAVGGVALVGIHRARLAQEAQEAARLRAEDVVAALEDEGPVADPAVLTEESPLTQIVGPSGRVVSASPDVQQLGPMIALRPVPGTKAVTTIHGLGSRDGRFRVVARGVEVAGAPYVVIVAQSLQPAQDSAADLAALLAAGLPFLLLLVGGLTWLAVGRALRPVEEIRREVEQIEAGELHRSVTPPGTRDEVDRLAHTMNAMLVRLADAEDAQRRFVADASHELRTPLTGIRAQLEVDLAHPERADWPATARGVLEDAIELQQLVGDLLALAELDAGRSVEPFRRPVDLDDVVLSEVARVRSTATVEIDARSVSGAQVLGDEGQLTRVVRNLLDNGVRHAAGRVTVELEERDVAACLRVTNDGPEIPTGDRARVFERFARLDDARGTDSGGTGLGLAIVREIVQRHGGTVEVLDGPGAAFLVTLPLSGERA